MTKQLQEKAIQIKGKDYVLVSDRVIFFNDTYKNGSIETELVSGTEDKRVIIKATVVPDVSNLERKFTGYSQALWGDGFINKSSALENAETSAIGRALASMGIGVIDSIASVDEINKAGQQDEIIDKSAIHDYIEESDEIKGLTAMCPVHNEIMTEKMSKNGKPYFSHIINGKHCFGQ